MISPQLLAQFNHEGEDAAQAISIILEAQDDVIADYGFDPQSRLEAVSLLSRAARMQLSTLFALVRTVAHEAERDIGAQLRRIEQEKS